MAKRAWIMQKKAAAIKAQKLVRAFLARRRFARRLAPHQSSEATTPAVARAAAPAHEDLVERVRGRRASMNPSPTSSRLDSPSWH
jgi:hypothetical protein